MITVTYNDFCMTIEASNGETKIIRADDPQFLQYTIKIKNRQNDLNLLKNGSRIDKVKAIRSLYGIGLREAVEICDTLSNATYPDNLDYPRKDSDSELTLGDILSSAMSK
jgi:hypothetical protein